MFGPGWGPQVGVPALRVPAIRAPALRVLALRARVREAIRVVRTGAHMDFTGIAHQMVIVDALGALARANISQDLGQPAVHAGIDEGGAAGVVGTPPDCDGVGCAAFVVVEGATGNTAIGNVSCHKRFLRIRLPGLDSVLAPTLGPFGPIKKTQLCDVIPPNA